MISAGCCNRTTGHILSVWCQLLRWNVCVLSKSGVDGVHVAITSQLPSGPASRLRTHGCDEKVWDWGKDTRQAEVASWTRVCSWAWRVFLECCTWDVLPASPGGRAGSCGVLCSANMSDQLCWCPLYVMRICAQLHFCVCLRMEKTLPSVWA